MTDPSSHVLAVIDYEDDYVQPLLLEAFTSLFPPDSYTIITNPTSSSLASIAGPDDPPKKILQIAQYEKIDFEYAASHPRTSLVNSYVIRKALIRKHFLSSVVDAWAAKRPGSVLGSHVRRAEAFEVDYAEFLDDALVEAFDLRASMERNERREEEGKGEREWWILKPSMSDRGQGIRLFSSMEELQDIFDRWEEDLPDSDDEEDEEEEATTEGKDYITTSHLRHFVAQPYIDPPLLLPETGNRKFHVRTYVLAVGCLQVYVYKHMLALFAGKAYRPPGTAGSGEEDLDAHLTNTCLQGPGARADSVARFSDLPLPPSLFGADDTTDPHAAVLSQIKAVTGDAFEAAARTAMVHFQPRANAFEVFGVDFLVDAAGKAWLLEINAFPDFRQTGDDPALRDVVAGFWRGVMAVAVVGSGFLPGGNGERLEEAGRDMLLVREVELGRG